MKISKMNSVEQRTWTRDRGVRYLDLVDPYLQEVLRGKRVYLPLDVHLDVHGHAVTAAALQRTGLLPNDDEQL